MSVFVKNSFQKIKTSIFIILCSIMVFIIWKNFSKIDFSLISNNWQVTLMILELAVVFLLIKSLMLFLTGRLFNVDKNYFYFLKVFCMSSFIELTTFSGKIGADGFKYLFWKDLSRKNRLSLIFFFRSADIFGFIWLILFLLLPLKLALIGLLSAIFFTYIHSRKEHKNESPESIKESLKSNWKLWLALSLISAVGYLIIISQLSLVFNALGLEITKGTLMIFLLSHGLGALSQLPFGLGVKDYSIYYLLNGFFSQSEILLGMIWVRLFGEFFLVLLGAFFTATYLKEK